MAQRLRKLAEAIGVALFLVMFAGFAAQVISRYVFNRPVIWSTDVILISYIWWFTWASALIVRKHEHIAFENVFRGRIGNAVTGLAVGLAVLAFLWILPGTVDYIRFMFGQTTGALDIPIGYVFLGFVIFNIGVPAQLLADWIRRARPAESEKTR